MLLNFTLRLCTGLMLVSATSWAQFKYTVDIAIPKNSSKNGVLLTSLNNLGEFVGYSFTSQGQQCFLYSNNTVTPLVSPNSGKQCVAYDINDKSQVVGWSSPRSGFPFPHAFLYSQGTMVDLGTLVGSAGSSYAFGINNEGQAVGQSSVSTRTTEMDAVLFWQGNITNLNPLVGLEGNSAIFSINDNLSAGNIGQIVGLSFPNESPTYGQAFIYLNGTLTNIGKIICLSEGYFKASNTVEINNAGQVIGYCADIKSSSEIIFSAFIYDSNDGNYSFINSTQGEGGNNVYGINDEGQIVGSNLSLRGDRLSSFLYVKGVEYNLLDLIDPNSNITEIMPVAINNLGQILANSNLGAVLLAPISEDLIY